MEKNSEANGVISAEAIDLAAVAATPSTGYYTHVAVEGATVADAKSYSVKQLTEYETKAIGTNVIKAFKLVDEDGVQSSATIKIYNDSSLKSVALNGQTLNVTYILVDGSESTVGVDISTFFAESEFNDGLQVVDGNVNVYEMNLKCKYLVLFAIFLFREKQYKWREKVRCLLNLKELPHSFVEILYFDNREQFLVLDSKWKNFIMEIYFKDFNEYMETIGLSHYITHENFKKAVTHSILFSGLKLPLTINITEFIDNFYCFKNA